MMGTASENVQVPGKLNVDGDATFVQNDITVSSGNQDLLFGCGSTSDGANENIRIGGTNTLRNIYDASGNKNIAIGTGNNLNKLTSGKQNIALGNNTLANATGNFNTAIGTNSGDDHTGGTCTFLGAFANVDSSSSNYTFSTAIGYNAKITKSHQIMMGLSSETIQVPGDLNVDGSAYLTNYVNQNDPNQVVPKSYVDALASGIVPTQSCLCATTGNLDLTSTAIPGSNDTDGVDLSRLSDGSYNILVRDQSNNVQNGVYIFTKNAVSGTWARPTYPEPMHAEFDANAAFSFVASGTIYGKVGLVQIRDPAIVGTNELEYTEFYQLQVNAGEGLNKTIQSTQLYINVDTSLNIVEYLDNNAGDLHLGAGDTTGNVVIGKEEPNQTTTIQNQANFVQNDITVSSGNQNIQIGSGPNDLKNIRIGDGCLLNPDPSGENNIAIGYNVLQNLTTAERNTFCGGASGKQITVSDNNTGFGLYALSNYNGTENDDYNTAIGSHAGRHVMNGTRNTFLGAGTEFDISNAGYRNSTAIGYAAIIDASNQIMMGTANENVQVPGNINVDGDATFVQNDITVSSGSDRPVLIGSGPKTINGDIIENIRFGRDCMDGTDDGSISLSGNGHNIAIGDKILRILTTGESNTFVGSNGPGEYITASSFNVGIGSNALRFFDGQEGRCTAIGSKAGRDALGGSKNTFLGADTDFNNGVNAYVQSTALGYNAKITESNQIMMGTASETVQVPGTLSYQNFRQPIMFSCQIKRRKDHEDDTNNKGYYIDTSSANVGFNVLYGVAEENYGVYAVSEKHLRVEIYAKNGGDGGLDKYYNVQVSGIKKKEGGTRKFSVEPVINHTNNYNEVNTEESRFDIRIDDELEKDEGGVIYVNVFYYPPL
jgi:hypothetical protein